MTKAQIMLIRRTICKTEKLFNKTLQNLKSFVSRGCKKLSRAPSLKFFSCGSNDPETRQLENFYKGLYDHWEPEISPGSNPGAEKTCSKVEVSSEQKVLKKKKEENGGVEEKKQRVRYQREEKRHEVVGLRSGNSLARKMRELEMMDVHDLDHVLDVEEVLYYYSRLKSPIYQDLVNTFFMDMYTEFSVPQPSVSKHNSMRRLGPLKI